MKRIIYFSYLFLLGFSVSAQELDTLKPDTRNDFYIDRLFHQSPKVSEPEGKTNQGLIARWHKYYSEIEEYRGPILNGWKRITQGDDLKMIYDVCLEYSIPYEVVFLALVESGWKNTAWNYSSGATGFWQFTLATARHYGLVIDRSRGIDERRDKRKSTEAAAHYLSDIYKRTYSWSKNPNITFSDRWLFAFVAYNRGEPKTKKVFTATGGRFFKYPVQFSKAKIYWETKNFNPRIFAARTWLRDYTEGKLDSILPVEDRYSTWVSGPHGTP